MPILYKDAGVDVEAGYEAVKLMKKHVQRTFNDNVLFGLGSFGGFYSLENEPMNKPVLVAGTDGVGTKLKIAFLLDKHDTVGIDCVAMCVNDVVCQGAKPLFFLDYIATGKLHPEKIEQIVKGVSEGCVRAGCALIGGETAEMPGFYPEDEYDMAGFTVGLVDKDRVISGEKVTSGDVLVGLASSGLHSNGFSLVRKLVREQRESLERYNDELGSSIGEELLTPTRIYVKSVLALIKRVDVHGIANITGGGFIENIPRILPEGLRARVKIGAWPIMPIFTMLQNMGDIPDHAIYNTFNMGIGMVMAVAPGDADALVSAAAELGERAYIIGEVVRGEAGVALCR